MMQRGETLACLVTDLAVPLVGSRGSLVDAFRTNILHSKDLGVCPVRQLGNASFLYMRVSNVYIVITVTSNCNAACAFKFAVEVSGCFAAQLPDLRKKGSSWS